MFLSMPAIIILALIILSVWNKYKRTSAALNDVYSALQPVYYANQLDRRGWQLSEMYAGVRDIKEKCDLVAANQLIDQFVDDPDEFSTQYEIDNIRNSLKFGIHAGRMSDLFAFIGNASTEMIEKRRKTLSTKEYINREMLSVRYRD